MPREVDHDGQAPARRPPETTPELHGEGELDAAGEGEIIVPPPHKEDVPVLETQLKLPVITAEPGRRSEN